MSLWKIAWRSIQQRALASSLTGFSMALGVAMVVAVMVIKGVVSQSFEGRKSMGYHFVVGKKGGREQLVLSTVFFVSKPIENIPYSVYQKFLPNGEYGPLVSKAVPMCLGDFYGEYRVVATTPAMLTNFDDDPDIVQFEFAEGRNFQFKNTVFVHNGENLRGNGFFEAVLGSEVARTTGKKVGDEINPRHGADEESAHVHDAFTIVGILKRTGTPSDRAVFINMEGFFLMPDHRKPVDEHEELHKAYEKLIERHHEFIETRRAILAEKEEQDRGAAAQDTLKVLITAEKALLFASLELAKDQDDIEVIDMRFDRALLKEAQPSLAAAARQLADTKAGQAEAGPYATLVKDHEDFIDKHQKLIEKTAAKAEADANEDTTAGDSHAAHDHSPRRTSWRKQRPLPDNQREVTAVLVRMQSDVVALGIQKQINKGEEAQAVFPVRVIKEMFNLFVGPLHLVLLGLTILIVIVSGVGILVSIYNSMSDRRHEIAVMRALGAARSTVMRVVLTESIMLSLAGGLTGWILGHGLIGVVSPWVEASTGIWIGPFKMAPDVTFGGVTIPMFGELVLIPGLIMLATLVGFLPALSAYRTDVAKSLTAKM